MTGRNRKRRELSTSEIVYGVIVIALILYVIIETAINGRGGNPTDNW